MPWRRRPVAGVRRSRLRHPAEPVATIIGILWGVLLIVSVIAIIGFAPDNVLSDVDDELFVIPLVPLGYGLYYRFQRARMAHGLLEAGPEQYPDIHATVVECAQVFGMRKVPRVYLTTVEAVNPCRADSGMRDIVLIGSDFYAGCRENETPEALRFAVAHQMGHIAAGHGRPRWQVSVLGIISVPILRALISHPVEYTADRYATAYLREAYMTASPEPGDEETTPAAPGDGESSASPAVLTQVELSRVMDAVNRALCLFAVGKDNYVFADMAQQLDYAATRRSLWARWMRYTSDQPAVVYRWAALERWSLRVWGDGRL